MTRGQELALGQLKGIGKHSSVRNRLEIESFEEVKSYWLKVMISVYCGHYEKKVGGIPLAAREAFEVWVQPDFPFSSSPPPIYTYNPAFANFSHVQVDGSGRRYQLCLYQAVNSEWNPSDGLLGFIGRLNDWLRSAAENNLDPPNAPMHPPIACLSSDAIVVPIADTPTVTSEPWLGFAHLKSFDKRIDITGWSEFPTKGTPEYLAPAILLSEPMPFVFPSHARYLIEALEARGVSRAQFLFHLGIAAYWNAKDKPLYVVVGTPMRGRRTEGHLKQHLQIWEMSSESMLPEAFSLSLETSISKSEAVKTIGTKVEKIIWDWLERASVSWCKVYEARDEVTIPRDKESQVAWFRHKTVEVWGCGALGAYVAESLVRAGCRKIILRDSSKVNPGILVRQPYYACEIGMEKSQALKQRLDGIHVKHSTEIVAVDDNILSNPLDDEEWICEADCIIDATASEIVRQKLELKLGSFKRRPHIVSMMIGHEAQRGLVAVISKDYTGGPMDVMRKAKIKALKSPQYKHFADDFWPDSPHPVFQPEPGCSDPTFIGGMSDVASLAMTLLNCAAATLKKAAPERAEVYLIAQPWIDLKDGSHTTHFGFQSDILSQDGWSGHQIRIAKNAWDEIMTLGLKAYKKFQGPQETGGIIFGEVNSALGIVWVDEIIGPPSDSKASKYYFDCGTKGIKEFSKEITARTRGTSQYIGYWHTHPDANPFPSERDVKGIGDVLNNESSDTKGVLFLIVGQIKAVGIPGSYLVSRSTYPQWGCEVQTINLGHHYIFRFQRKERNGSGQKRPGFSFIRRRK